MSRSLLLCWRDRYCRKATRYVRLRRQVSCLRPTRVIQVVPETERIRVLVDAASSGKPIFPKRLKHVIALGPSSWACCRCTTSARTTPRPSKVICNRRSAARPWSSDCSARSLASSAGCADHNDLALLTAHKRRPPGQPHSRGWVANEE